MIITHFQAKKLLQAKRSGASKLGISLDLGKTFSEVTIKTDRFIFPEDQVIKAGKVKKVLKKNKSCFFIKDNDIEKIQFFNHQTNKYYKLFPARDWPTIEISGIRMHVTKSMSPKKDTEEKLRFIGPVFGKVLDTCTGLGYTAILASRTALKVYTFEIDQAVIELEKINPWSRELFTNKKIKRQKGDIFNKIKLMEDEFYDIIIHDPPRLSLSTLLYSQEFYNQMFRVIKQTGKFYHYTGNPGKKNRNVNLKKNVMKRLRIAGFSALKDVFNGVVGERL
ncbi:SAM-dependent methyltransferase [Candidatus Woesearchaeota archaeon]|nr:SAM-dependent methyltransferase [Candidatus Woesearchaeota archaeon]